MAEVQDLTGVLSAAQSPDPAQRQEADKALNAFRDGNFVGYVVSLCAELATEGKAPENRALAGLVLKNDLDAKDPKTRAQYAERWRAVAGPVKAQIRAAVLATLASPVNEARRTAAQVITVIAHIELPHKECPDLIQTLLNNMGGSTAVREATLLAIGYICESLPSDVLRQDEVNSVLTAIVQGMDRNDALPQAEGVAIRLAATQALANALEFASQNFKKEQERNIIMKVVFEGAVFEDVRVRQASMECLVSIAAEYYDELLPYMQHALQVTLNAVRTDEEGVALQALEFWTTIADEEATIQQEILEEGSSDSTNHNITKQALPMLVPLLLETMLKQEEGSELDEGLWNPAAGAGVCLVTASSVAADDIVPLVMPFVQERVGDQTNWRNREAAIMAFGSILEGPSRTVLQPRIKEGLPFFLNTLATDKHPYVRDTTAWVLKQIFEIHHGANVAEEEGTATTVPPLFEHTEIATILGVLVNCLKEAPNLSGKACGAIQFFSSGFAGSELSPYFKDVVQSLLAVAERQDSNEANLAMCAYEALNEVLSSSADDTIDIIMRLIPVILEKLNAVLSTPASSAEMREKQNKAFELLCAVLTVITQRLSDDERYKSSFIQFEDHIMLAYFRVFESSTTTVHQEAMTATGALINAVGEHYERHMERLFPVLQRGLKNHDEAETCKITVGVVNDLCHALEKKLLPYCDGIMQVLIENLHSQDVQMSLKPPILSTFGDIALAIGPHFVKYLQYVVQMLVSAADLSKTTQGNESMAEYNDLLRVGIFEAYAGILNGLGEQQGLASAQMAPYTEKIYLFIEEVASDDDCDTSVYRAAAGLLGDLSSLIDGIGAAFKARPFFMEFFDKKCLERNDKELNETVSFARANILAAIAKAR
mmetsp:Transcript_14375/g.47212  ORF Transcript_14375/g.47212 Transcript_14375/m.47212 type:complete len:885 (+) Transcript_14375:177-2831(+)